MALAGCEGWDNKRFKLTHGNSGEVSKRFRLIENSKRDRKLPFVACDLRSDKTDNPKNA